MSIAKSTNLKLRSTGYRGLIPFTVLLDLKLSGTAVRIYGIIEQMESRPNGESVFFNNRYLSNILHVTIRQIQNAAKELRDKGYINRKEISPGRWEWSTVKNAPVEEYEEISEQDMDEEPVKTGHDTGNQGCNESSPPHAPPLRDPMQSHFVHNNQNLNFQNSETHPLTTTTVNLIDNARALSTLPEIEPTPTTPPDQPRSGEVSVLDSNPEEVRKESAVSAGCIISEFDDKDLIMHAKGSPMHAKDNREFLFWCKWCLDNTIKADTEEGKLRVLRKWIEKGLTRPVGYGEKKVASKPLSERDKFAHNATMGDAYQERVAKRDPRSVAEIIAQNERNKIHSARILASLATIGKRDW